jgi:hypothetical protein
MWLGDVEAARVEIRHRQERVRAEIAADRRAGQSAAAWRAAHSPPGPSGWRGWLVRLLTPRRPQAARFGRREQPADRAPEAGGA